MKKLFVTFLTITLFCTLYAAVNPTPFAYNLSSTYNQVNYDLTINYALNAPATNANLVILDGESVAKTIAIPAEKLTKGSHTFTTSMLGIDAKSYNWRIDVYGIERTELQQCTNSLPPLFQQFSIDIDNNPTSPYFGRILVTQPVAYDLTNGVKTYPDAGLYEYTPQLGTPTCHNGGLTYNKTEDYYNYSHYTPHRVRIAQDGTGRVFVTSCDLDMSTYLWSVDQETLNTWTPLLTTSQMKTFQGSTGVLHNSGLDIRGEGDDLTLLLFSGMMGDGAAASAADKYYACEYQPYKDASSAAKILTVPTASRATCTQSNAQYDGYGGVWYIHYKKDQASAGLFHKTSDQAWEKSWPTGSATHLQSKNLASAAFRYNHKNSIVAVAQWANISSFAIYTVKNLSATSSPDLSTRTVPATNVADGGSFVEDFAWDYAGNLYVCSRKKVFLYAGISKADQAVSTPATSSFSVIHSDATFMVTANVKDADRGEVEGSGTYPIGATATLIATTTNSKAYEFEKWTENGNLVSTSATYSFTVTGDRILTAHFKEIEYTVEYFNLFKNHEDITTYWEENDQVDNERNTRLWRLLQVEYNKFDYPGASQADKGETSGTTESGATRPQYKVLEFVNRSYHNFDSEGMRNRLEAFLDTDKSNFRWLGAYIESLLDKDVNNINTVNVWGFYLQSFINRTTKSHNQSFEFSTSVGGEITTGYKVISFSTAGKPENWRPWWQDALGLYTKSNYTEVPTGWNNYALPVGWSIADANKSSTIYNPCEAWCEWNDQKANPGKLLAWYYDDKLNPKWPSNPTITRYIDQSGSLFATWVDNLLSESLTDEKNSDVIWLFNHHAGTHDIKIDRKMQGGMYNTLCLPFSVNESQLAAALPGATVMQFTGVDKDLYDESGDPVAVLNFTQVTSMEAGVPYLVKPAADITSAITFSGITTGYNGENPIVIETAPEQTPISLGDGGSVTFQGTILSTKVYPGQFILVANDRLAQVTQPGDMAGMRGYFIINDPGLQTLAEQGRVYLSMKKPVTTSIPVAPEAEQQRKPEVRKIMRNGQIYIIRDGITYTITGARVR